MKVFAHSSCLPSTAEALQRVFLPSLPLVLKTIPSRNVPRHRLPIVPRRHAPFLAPVQQQRPTKPQDAGRPRDEAIGSQQTQIQVANPDGLLQPPSSLRETLASIDRQLNFLVHVGDKVHPRYVNEPEPEEGQPDTRPKIPVCRVIPKADYRLAEASKHKPKKDVAASSKELEVHWSMAPNDLNHRLDRLKEFLEQGRRVEIIFGKKRKGWKGRKDGSEEGAKHVLKQIRDTVAEVEGAREWKEMDGQLMGSLTMFFEAKKERMGTEVKKKYQGEYKVKKKFQAAHEEKLAGFSPAAR